MNINDVLKIFGASSIDEFIKQSSDEVIKSLVSQIGEDALLSPDVSNLVAYATTYAIGKSLENTIKIVNYVVENNK